MGRSGTSYVASILDQAGVDMGRELKSPDEHNPRGYFEDLEALLMHQGWLEELDLSFASVDERFPIDPGPERREQIAAFVGRRQRETGRWGLKAPGVLFFWPAWRDVLPPHTLLLVPFRHPEGTLRSVERAGLGRDQALGLWIQLNRLAIEAVDEGPFDSVFLDFDDRRKLAAQLAPLLGPYLDPYELQLQHYGRGQLPEDAEVRALYEELCARAY